MKKEVARNFNPYETIKGVLSMETLVQPKGIDKKKDNLIILLRKDLTQLNNAGISPEYFISKLQNGERQDLEDDAMDKYMALANVEREYRWKMSSKEYEDLDNKLAFLGDFSTFIDRILERNSRLPVKKRVI